MWAPRAGACTPGAPTSTAAPSRARAMRSISVAGGCRATRAAAEHCRTVFGGGSDMTSTAADVPSGMDVSPNGTLTPSGDDTSGPGGATR